MPVRQLRPNELTACINGSASEPLLAQQYIPKWMPIFPAIGTKIALIGSQNIAVPQLASQHDERRISQIHRQIGVFMHQRLNGRAMSSGQGEHIKMSVYPLRDKFLLNELPSPPQ